MTLARMSHDRSDEQMPHHERLANLMTSRADSMDLPTPTIDLFWIPLGEGGSGLVRATGRIYEWVKAHREHRRPKRLLHTALQVHLPEGRFVVETMWPSPDTDHVRRGVVVSGDVWARRLGLTHWLRYEVRCWRDGVLPDSSAAIGGPRAISNDIAVARRLLKQTHSVPGLVWGRDEMGIGEMWNSNSVIAWLLTTCGLPIEAIQPPRGTRAPGWEAGIAVARAQDRGTTGSATSRGLLPHPGTTSSG